MKKMIFSWGTLLSLFLIALMGCQKENNRDGEEYNTENRTITDIITDAKTVFSIRPTSGGGDARASAGKQVKFTYLAVALARTGLTDDLAKLDGSYTLFAPTDDAFKAAGFNTIQDVIKTPVEVLTPILLYHVIASKITAAEVPAGPNAAVITLNGAQAFVTRKNDGSVFINGVPVILADVRAVNGIIHVIDKILMPPTGNIVQTAVAASPEFSYLVAAVLRASQGSTDVAALLSGEGPFTVFAPTNQAFMNAGFNSIADIMNAAPNSLTPILAYHVIGGRVFSSDLVDGITPAMLAGGTTTITLTGGPKIKGSSNAGPANIIKTDIVCSNGVIHVIDAVLLP